jgi:type IV pilus assembly protein PilX
MRAKTNRSRQDGAILVVSLLLLLVMTLLGLTAMQVTRMEERMAGNSRDISLAFQAAEAGLRDAEDRIRVMTTRPAACSAGPCAVWQRTTPVATLPTDLHDQPKSWWVGKAQEYGAAGTQQMTEVTQDPLSITQEQGFIPDSLTTGHGPPEGRDFYRVTSHSFGATETARAVLESTYTRRF